MLYPQNGFCGFKLQDATGRMKPACWEVNGVKWCGQRKGGDDVKAISSCQEPECPRTKKTSSNASSMRWCT
ncbi:hypothetical protein PC128_g20228, partial [Phytophthora cactorum]